MFTHNIRHLAIFFLISLSSNLGSGLKCYKCNSQIIADCATDPSDQLPTEECPDEDAECAMAVFDDMVTYRGCKSNVQMPEGCTHCLNATCTGDLCNGGIYPENRLKCHRCQREKCVTVSGQPKACQNYDISDFCYIDVIDETDVIRGCISDSDYDAGVYTVFCRTDGCNNAPAVSEFSCIACDSEKHENCKHGDQSGLVCEVNATNVCTVDVLHGRRESCYTFHDGLRVIRGCNRLDPEIVMQTKYITICRQSKCNNACISSPMCYVCDSREDENCYSDQTALTPHNCPLETSSCFTCKYDDASVIRGCRDKTTLFDSERCLSCWKTDSCNTELLQICASCNSAIDKNCATWFNESSIETVACDGQCIIRITSEGYTVRGCLTGSFRCAAGDSLCIQCDGDNCNRGVFPTNRQMCYQCDESNPTCKLDQTDKIPVACYDYSANDGCYQYINSKGFMVRGCLSDSRYEGCKASGDNSCEICREQKCNYRGVDPGHLQCHYCHSDDNPACGWAQSGSKDCLPKTINSTFAACFSYQLQNRTIIRGCMSDDNACDPTDVTCEICSRNRCNGVNLIYQTCIQCNSTIGQGRCALHPADIEPTMCWGDIQFYEDRGCYVKWQSQIVVRGCLNDLDSEEIISCQQETNCTTCLGQGCNRQVIFNTASPLRFSSFFCTTIFVLFLII